MSAPFESIFIGDSTNPFLGGELLFFGLPPCLPILLKDVPLADNDRDAVADTPSGRPIEVEQLVVGVIEIKLSGGGCIGRGSDRGKDKGVEDEGLNPF